MKWLFNAANHLLQIRAGEAEASEAVPVEVPPYAEVLDDAQDKENQLLHPTESAVRRWANEVETIFKRISRNVRYLRELLDREVDLGENAVTDMNLQSEIRGKRVGIVKDQLTKLASIIELAYGIRLTAPAQLIELLEV